MKLAKMNAPYDISMLDVPVPEIAPDQVLMRVCRVGICGSDMQVYHGKHKYIAFPVIPGHEVAGIVEKTGDNVTDYKAGDPVVMQPQVTCGVCEPCRQGRFNVCETQRSMGAHLPGGACEYMAVGARYLHHIPAEMSMDDAVLVEPFAVGVGSVRRSRRVPGGNVTVIGSGTIGNCVAQAAKAAGAAAVLICGSNPEHLRYAKECGIDYCVNTKETSLKEAVQKHFGVRKADVIIDCAGVPALFEEVLEAARPNSDIVLTANYKEPVTFFPPVLQRQEISLIGHMMYVREDFAEAVRCIAEGIFHTAGFITRKLPFEQYPEAFRYQDEHKREIMKVVVTMQS